MIENFTIKNIRQFQEFSVEDLRQINLFVGRNNSGKTTILEALEVATSQLPIGSIRRLSERRQETQRLFVEDDRGYRLAGIDISHFFRGHAIQDGSYLSISGTGLGETSVFAMESEQLILEMPDGEIPADLIIQGSKSGNIAERYPLLENGYLRPNRRLTGQPYLPPFTGALFLGRDLMHSAFLATQLNKIALNSDNYLVVNALRVVNPQIKDYFPLVPEQPGGDPMILLEIEGNGRHPLGSFGDGTRSMLAVAVALLNARDNVLLIDELDSGLHYSLMQELWLYILMISKMYNVQLFATTHSLDCIRGLSDALDKVPGSNESVAVHKLDSRTSKAVTFTGESLLNALTGDLELR